jgi:hypothetical protein
MRCTARVTFNCSTTNEPVGLPLTANSLDELALVSFVGVTFDECPRCGRAHEIDVDECFLRDDDEGAGVGVL